MQSNNFLDSIEACAAHYGDSGDHVREYLRSGLKAAFEMENRGPLRFGPNGLLQSDILDAYNKYGFYVFEQVIDRNELEVLQAEWEGLTNHFPTSSKSSVDAQGRTALGEGNLGRRFVWTKPLGDPAGGTDYAGGRHQIKVFEPKAAEDAPEEVPLILLGMHQYFESCLRLYGHPDLLRIMESLNGPDFCPIYDSVFIKEPGRGGAVSWHQDGTTHWDTEKFDANCHGFNIMVQLYGSTPVNGVWYLPGTHATGKVDIRKIAVDAGSERLPGAIPLVCEPGDVVITNRQAVHGSFPNSGFERRITLNFGTAKRDCVEGVKGLGVHTGVPATYDKKRIDRRCRMIGYAIDARRQFYPSEKSYTYKPHDTAGLSFTWDDAARRDIRDYNVDDLSI